jgi:hypothetical protein
MGWPEAYPVSDKPGKVSSPILVLARQTACSPVAGAWQRVGAAGWWGGQLARHGGRWPSRWAGRRKSPTERDLRLILRLSVRSRESGPPSPTGAVLAGARPDVLSNSLGVGRERASG